MDTLLKILIDAEGSIGDSVAHSHLVLMNEIGKSLYAAHPCVKIMSSFCPGFVRLLTRQKKTYCIPPKKILGLADSY